MFALLDIPLQFALLLTFFYTFIAQPFTVTGYTMSPNFNNGQYILAEKITYKFQPPKRGDVVIFTNPQNENQDFIKRVIGLPGEKVAVKNNKVWINGQLLDESSYLPQSVNTPPGSIFGENLELQIPENSYFILGDNREKSFDSRNFGFLKKDKILLKYLLCYYHCNS